MVLLNLDVRLKSLPLPFGRSCKSGSASGTGISSQGQSLSDTAPATPPSSSSASAPRDRSQLDNLRLTNDSKCTNSTNEVSPTVSGDGLQNGRLSSSIAEALLNYSLIGSSIHLACADCSEEQEGLKLSQTLPTRYNFGGSASDLSATLPTTRCQRSFSTTDYRSTRIRRRLTLNPAWKAVSFCGFISV